MPCTLGNYIDYAINVTEHADISKGVVFATKHNIRLVIRNTGHDYNGKSTGAGALGIWTHNLKSIQFLDYHGPTYTGKAIRMGAGVQGFEAVDAGNKVGLTVTGGECPTVGLAGGYTQGGGHSALASKYGPAADQTLEWEVITGSGKFIKASPTENSDMYCTYFSSKTFFLQYIGTSSESQDNCSERQTFFCLTTPLLTCRIALVEKNAGTELGQGHSAEAEVALMASSTP